MVNWNNINPYCKNCGQECTPIKYIRPKEDYDPPGTYAFVGDWRSSCCKDELSEDPVTHLCACCTATAYMGETFNLVDRELMCPDCERDYRADHPDMEEEIAKTEYREER